MARTIVTRTAVKGRIECHGLSWKCDALLEWENRQRELGLEPKVDVRIDELDLSVVYIDVPDRSVGPFRAISRQPNFTEGLSLFELKRLKEIVKSKALVDRLGRLEDTEAMGLRVDYYEALGHGKDPVAKKRLSDRMNEMARLRLSQVQPGDDAPAEPAPAPASAKRSTGKAGRQKKGSVPPVPQPPTAAAAEVPATSITKEEDGTAAGSPQAHAAGGLPPAKYKTVQVKRRSP